MLSWQILTTQSLDSTVDLERFKNPSRGGLTPDWRQLFDCVLADCLPRNIPTIVKIQYLHIFNLHIVITNNTTTQ